LGPWRAAHAALPPRLPQPSAASCHRGNMSNTHAPCLLPALPTTTVAFAAPRVASALQLAQPQTKQRCDRDCGPLRVDGISGCSRSRRLAPCNCSKLQRHVLVDWRPPPNSSIVLTPTFLACIGSWLISCGAWGTTRWAQAASLHGHCSAAQRTRAPQAASRM